MCGRYSFAPDLKIVNEHYDISVNDGDLTPNYNCAPSQLLPVITNDKSIGFNFFRWGLIPFWAKDISIGNKFINARSETILEKPSFRNAFRQRRCLVPADAFYEWKQEVKEKIPYRIFLKNQNIFSMAGIWEKCKLPNGETIFSFAIITTQPNTLMTKIHNRMPVILDKKGEDLWINNTDEKELTNLLKPFPAEQMTAYRISNLVNSPRNNSPKIIEPIADNSLFN
ncbi:MAG: SOS response-associated peptidase [Bacteroidales bacterium]|jgi:putative SOS response-associated peptidase YedK|nr:SOS response-associated peptidase [Bacteroidales bacterium]MDI9591998.1 SOS response-associated peptidase [Bacteroidota bacterium]HOF80891.1 SOS response-associated peptidase [Bacteroidales bacterium]HOR76236.1 SOS response-associated peptidase [Bacteroidales bacterium]HPL11643.1 SOS response-associated peptidase [Bacteroidales bacterium]